MNKQTTQTRQAYVTPDIRIRPIRTELSFLATATIPEYNETEEEW